MSVFDFSIDFSSLRFRGILSIGGLCSGFHDFRLGSLFHGGFHLSLIVFLFVLSQAFCAIGS